MLKNTFLCIILIFFGLHVMVLSKSIISTDAHETVTDDYDYDADDHGNVNSQLKPLATNELKPYFKENRSNATVLINKDITIQCDVMNFKDNVILWYKNEKPISNGNNLFSPMHSLDPNTYALTIINATKSNQGIYFCEVLPQKIKKHIQLIVIDPELEVFIPENSESFKQNSSNRLSISILFSYLSILLLRV